MNGHASAAARAPFGPTLALTVAVAVGAFALIAPLALGLIEPTQLRPPFGEQNQDAETLLFIAAFALILPAAVIVVPRVADRVGARHGVGAVSGLAALLLAALVGTLLAVKVSERLPWGGGREVLAVFAAAWCALAAGALALGLGDRAGGGLRALGRRSTPLWLAAAVLLAPLALSLADLGSIALLPLAAGLLVAVAAILAAEGDRVLALRRPWGRWADGLVAVLLLLVVPNLVLFSFEDPAAATDTSIIQFHQDFFLGPANHVIHGSPMLVDSFSQYGVGSIVFLAGVFEVVPIGNGTLGLIEGLLAAAVFVLAYFVLRLAGVSRILAATAMTVAVVALVLGLQYRLGGLLQHGAIRFGLPIGVLVAAVVAASRPRLEGPARIGGLCVVAVSSIWALEAFGYTLLTLAGVLAFSAGTLPSGERRGWLLRRAAEVAIACVAAHLVFAGVTLAASGELPRWGAYLETLREFLVGGIGDLTYDFTPWSPALAVGALYLGSAAAIVLAVRRTDLASRERTALLALSGTTAYGIALFSYFVNRSADHILPYICLPAVMVVALWLSLLRRPAPGTPARTVRIASGLTAAAAVLLVSVAWSSAGTRFSESALGLAAPGGDSLGGALERLWERPPLKPGAQEGERLLERYMPDEDESIVLTDADLGVEVLVRTDRRNRIPLSDPWEDSLAPDQHTEALAETIDGLEAGELMLIDEPALDVFEGYLDEPGRDPLVEPLSTTPIVPAGITVLQELVLDRIGERFRLEPVASGGEGLSVVELVPV